MKTVAVCQKNYGKLHVKANIGVSRMKSRTLAKFQQSVRTLKSCSSNLMFAVNMPSQHSF